MREEERVMGTTRSRSDGRINPGRKLEGTKWPDMRKTTDQQVVELRARRALGESLEALAKRFGVSVATASNIAARRSRKSVDPGGAQQSNVERMLRDGEEGKLTRPVVWGRAKLHPEDVVEMRELADAGETSLEALSEKFKVKPHTVLSVVFGASWKSTPGPIQKLPFPRKG